MATKSGLVSSEPFLPDVAANGGQTADLDSGQLFRSKPAAMGSRLFSLCVCSCLCADRIHLRLTPQLGEPDIASYMSRTARLFIEGTMMKTIFVFVTFGGSKQRA